MYCNNCGHKNPDGANFCSSCGAALTEAGVSDTTITFMPHDLDTDLEEEVHIGPEELEGGRGVLIVRKGPNAGSKFFLDSDATRIGRHPDSDIFLDDITVSRRHAEIRRRGGFRLHDVGSLNGTYVNRERVEETNLRSGDEIQIGKFRLVFLSGS